MFWISPMINLFRSLNKLFQLGLQDEETMRLMKLGNTIGSVRNVARRCLSLN